MENSTKNSLQNIFRFTGMLFLILLVIEFLAYEYQYDALAELASLVMIFLLLLSYFLLNQYIIRPIIQLNEFTKKITEGKHEELFTYEYENEIGELAATIEDMNQYVSNATQFVKEIADGNLDSEYKEYSNFGQKHGNLAQALVQMRNQMKSFSEIERQRNWITTGLAQFIEILQTDHSNMEHLYDLIIANLVNYLGANQGALFIAQQQEQHTYLQMIACYAYDRKKYFDKTIQEGEGLLGQVILERKTIYLTDIPKGYLQINSGLGSADPKSIVILPLVTNEKIYGAIEIASLQVIEAYQIEFLERIADNISSTVGGIMNAKLNQELVQELQEQSEEMRAQDEEMRQNLEELMATQEEMQRKQKETEQLNEKLSANEGILKKALLKAKEKEKELSNQKNQLDRQLQEIQQTKEDLETKQTEMEKLNQRFEQNQLVLQKAYLKNQEKEQHYQSQIEELKKIIEDQHQAIEKLKKN